MAASSVAGAAYVDDPSGSGIGVRVRSGKSCWAWPNVTSNSGRMAGCVSNIEEVKSALWDNAALSGHIASHPSSSSSAHAIRAEKRTG